MSYGFTLVVMELWYCLVCNIKNNLDRLPFTHCDNTELINIDHNNSMRFLESLPNVEIINERRTFSDSFNEISNELPSKTSCKYYSINDFQSLNIQDKLNIFHANVCGLGSKLDNLQEFLYTSQQSQKLLKKKILFFCIILKLKVMKIIIHLPKH